MLPRFSEHKSSCQEVLYIVVVLQKAMMLYSYFTPVLKSFEKYLVKAFQLSGSPIICNFTKNCTSLQIFFRELTLMATSDGNFQLFHDGSPYHIEIFLQTRAHNFGSSESKS